MSAPKYDALIKVGRKDYAKLSHVIQTIKHLIPQPSKIFVISPDGVRPEGTSYDEKIVVVKDEDVFPGVDRDEIPLRKNWCFATFMALFQDVTEQDYYFDIQADNFFMKPLSLFKEDGTPIFFMSPQHSHYHQPYFNFSKKMFDLERVGDDSFIIDFMMYNKNITKELLAPYGSFEEFYKEACRNINKASYPTEQDCFANWCLKHHPGMYEVQKGVVTRLMGKNYPENYSGDEIEQILNSGMYPDEVAVSLHTWGDGDDLSAGGDSRSSFRSFMVRVGRTLTRGVKVGRGA